MNRMLDIHNITIINNKSQNWIKIQLNKEIKEIKKQKNKHKIHELIDEAKNILENNFCKLEY